MRFDGATLGEFLKKAEIKDDQHFRIVSPEPVIQESNQYKDKNGAPTKRYIWKVWYGGQKWSVELNWTSIKAITEVYGADSADWVNKWIVSKNNFDMGKKKNFLYFFPVEDSVNKKLTEQFPPEAKQEGEVTSPEQVNWNE
jgi:hypothetical protein